MYLVPRLSSFYPRKNALIRTVIIDYLFLTTARLGYNDDDKCKQRGDPASNGALLANAFSSGIGVMVSVFQIIFPWRVFIKMGMLFTTEKEICCQKIKDFSLGGDPGNWGIFWGPYEPSSKCGDGCLGQVVHQIFSLHMSQYL